MSSHHTVQHMVKSTLLSRHAFRKYVTMIIPQLTNQIHPSITTIIEDKSRTKRHVCSFSSTSTSSGISSTINKNEGKVQLLDTRSEVKLLVLNEAKEIADKAKINYQDNQEGYEEWIGHETNLSDAYSKAIKYTARLRSKDTALKSSKLLEEMIGRHGMSSTSTFYSFKEGDVDVGGIFIDDDVIGATIKSLKFDNSGNVKLNGTSTDFQQIGHNDMTTSIPPPKKQDFSNILHSWGSSKARRKGLYAETLLWRMMELAILQPGYFEFPDSKMFALVIKCYAGSTRKFS